MIQICITSYLNIGITFDTENAVFSITYKYIEPNGNYKFFGNGCMPSCVK